jgi:2-iminobutanoate/2-iminopropanoate deaminase
LILGSVALTLQAFPLQEVLAMPSKRVVTSQAPKPVGPYSQGVISGGFLFCSGQIAMDPASGRLVEGGIDAQAEQVLQNLLAVLREAKMGAENVVKTTVYLADMGDFSKMNEVYERHLGKHAPARTTVQVAALPMGVRVEIDVVAAF